MKKRYKYYFYENKNAWFCGPKTSISKETYCFMMKMFGYQIWDIPFGKICMEFYRKQNTNINIKQEV